jgi:hypothetical protein
MLMDMSSSPEPSSTKTCIFCDTELTAITKPEHILLNGLGGRKSSRTLICDEHNGSFGSTVDKALLDQVPAIRNMLQLESGQGKPPPMLRGVEAGKAVFNVRNDGSFQQVERPFTITKREDRATMLGISARSWEHVAELIPDIAAALKITEDKVRDMLKASQAESVWRRPGPIRYDVLLGGPEALRSMAKACLELWATVAGKDEVKSPAFSAARQFILSGDADFLQDRINRDDRHLPCASPLAASFGDFFNLIYVQSDVSGRVIGHFTLYNMMAWQIVLSDSGGQPDRRVGLASNPLDPGVWSDAIAEEFDIGCAWLSTPEIDDDQARFASRVEAMIKHHQWKGMGASVEHIAAQELKKFGIADLLTEPDHRKRLNAIQAISHRVALHVMNVPHSQKLGPDEVAAKLNEAEATKA